MRNPIKITYDKSKSIEIEKNYIIDNFLSQENDMGYSIVRTHLNGSHPFMKNLMSNRTYYFLKGEGRFQFKNEYIDVIEGEMIVIPKNTNYAFEGNFDAILVDCPAFNSNDDVIFKD